MNQTVTSQQALTLIIDALADAVAARIADRAQEQKEVYTFAEAAARYGVNKESIRRKVANGEFGDLVHFSERVHLITAEGIRHYDATHTGPPGEGRTRKAQRRKPRRPDPGPI